MKEIKAPEEEVLNRPIKSCIPNQTLRRWGIEAGMSIVIGIAAGCIVYALLNNEAKADKGLTPTTAAIEAEVDAQEPAADTEPAEEQAPAEEVQPAVEDVDAYMGTMAPALSGMSTEEIEALISERSGNLSKTKYWDAVSSYWETNRNVKDSSRFMMYLFDTDKKVYTQADFEGVPAAVLHVAKNEIYARHGYSFKDTDLFYYFMGQAWYTPSVLPKDFTEDVFTETEVKNLDLINSLDTY